MEFNEYQKEADKTTLYRGESKTKNLMYAALGLCGESGEVAEKIKKIYRNHGGEVSEERKIELAKELGDVLWYVSALATELHINLDTVADLNLSKLSDRHKRNVIASEGDNR